MRITWGRRTAPPPSTVFQYSIDDLSTDKCVDDEWCRREGGHERAPLEWRKIGDDDVRDEVESCVATARTDGKACG